MTGEPPPFGGGVYLADKSAWECARRDAGLAVEWERAIQADQIRTCSVVNMELLYSTRNADEYAAWEEALSALRNIPIARTEWNAVATALRELAARDRGYHRVPIPDALIAAVAQERAIGVLHYDRHYDRLREVMEFESRWIVPAGTI